MMWNWYSEHGTVDIVTKFVAETDESDPLIRLVQNQTGVISVMCDKPVDYMDLYIETGSGERSVFTLTESDYWAVDNNGFVLSRSHGTNRAELASGIFSAGESPSAGSYALAYLTINETFTQNDVMSVSVQNPSDRVC